MGTIETSELMTVAKLAGIRAIYGAKSATEQSIFTQIRRLERKETTERVVGFEVVRLGSAVMVRIIDRDLAAFSGKLDAWVASYRKKIS